MSSIDRRRFRADVQGLRAVAVGLVLLYHAGFPLVTGGYVGVDVFFVISGFLISSHLMEALERDGRIRFGEFYGRRVRRILPASLAVALLTAIAAVIFYPPLALERVLRDGLATIAYVPNIWFAVQNTDYLADHSASPYQHYWSLGVEEQFYLLWPLILVALTLLFRHRRAMVIFGIATLTAVSLIGGAIMTQLDQPAAFFLLPTRAWELLIGALVGAVLLRRELPLPRWIEALGGWMGIVMILAAALLYDDTTAFPGMAAALPTFGTAMVILFGARSVQGGPTRALSLKPMQFFGLISYSLYLVHWPLLIVTQAAVGEQNPLGLPAKFILGIILAVPLAWLLFRFVETPLRAPATLVSRPARVTLLTSLGLTVVLALGMLSGVQWSAQRLTGNGGEVSAVPDFPVAPPVATGFVPQNMTPALAQVAEDLAPVFEDGCQLDVKTESVQDCEYGDPRGDSTIAVFGDSHAAQWLPAVSAFADSHPGTSLRTYTKSSCPAAEATILVKGVPYASCDRWRELVIEHLVADPPDVVVISNYAHYALAESPDGARRLQLWSEGISETVRRLRAAGSEVIIIADSPRLRAAPATCVSTDVADASRCDEEREWAIDDRLASSEKEAGEGAGARYVDLTEYICDDSTCPVIIGNIFVYRDVNHLTASFVRYLAPALNADLADLLGSSSHTAP
ncbi:predicted acyltransferase [Microbacterium sp. HM58-2]|nr:predicted acyltransferase [Microbacterium sp. HM58-2]